MNLTRKKLTVAAPPIPNVEVQLHYTIKPASQKAFLLRSESDNSPLTLHGPNGNVVVILTEPGTLYVDLSDSIKSFSLTIRCNAFSHGF
jgi:NAD(P)H-flavin reductase